MPTVFRLRGDTLLDLLVTLALLWLKWNKLGARHTARFEAVIWL